MWVRQKFQNVVFVTLRYYYTGGVQIAPFTALQELIALDSKAAVLEEEVRLCQIVSHHVTVL